MVEPLYGALGSGKPGKMAQMPHLNSLWVPFRPNPHLLNANRRTVERPHVYIGQGSGYDRSIAHTKKSAREHVRYWQ